MTEQTEVKVDSPPNMAEIEAAFNVKQGNIVFAYAPHIYNPMGKLLMPEIIAHELTHIERQGTDPAAWWRQYIDDVAFRFREEVVAHHVEYVEFKKRVRDRNARSKMHLLIAKKLINPLYGFTGLTLHKALSVVMNGKKYA
jgi:hypothetical protein